MDATFAAIEHLKFMKQESQYHILVIDDTPLVAERIRRLLPHDEVAAAYNGVNGLDYARSHQYLDLVVLDIRMPHNGIRVARQLREINRVLRILPFSDYDRKDDVLQEIGCAPLVSKSVTDNQLVAAIRQALVMPVQPLPKTAIMNHYYDESQEAEDDLRQSLSTTAALLVSSRTLMPVIEQALTQARSTVVAKTANARSLEPYLPAMKPKILVADAGSQSAAQTLAHAHALPLLVVGLSLADAYSALVGDPQGVVFDLADGLHNALLALERGQRYRDPILAQALDEYELTEGQQSLIPFLLRGWEYKDIAKKVPLTAGTIRNYKLEIFKLFGVDDIGELRDKLNATVAEV